MTQYTPLAVIAVLAAACTGNPSPASPGAATDGQPAAVPEAEPVDAVTAAAATITPDDMYRRIAWLASDELGGRDTPSPGLEMAARYIADEFRALGLSAAGDSGSFIQRYQFKRTRFDVEKTKLTVSAGGTTVAAGVGRDFFLLPAMNRSSATASILYAGTAGAGATIAPNAGSFGMFFLPGAEPGQEWQQSIQAALGASVGAGLAGVILVLDPGFDPGMIGQINQQTSAQQAPFFLIGLRYEIAQQILANAGQDLDALRQSEPSEATVLEDASLDIEVASSTEEHRPPNVVGMLVGSDAVLRNEYIVFSAHMDHVGIGAPDATGDSIFNGADDDASGTATMIEVAEAFASLPNRPARSLIFLAVSGEEKGLLGSGWFVEHPPVPIRQIVADINLDRVGRNAPDTVVAIGQDYSTLGEIVQQVAARNPSLGLVVAPDLWPEENLFTRSDHFNFAKAGVPAIFFTTGLHDEYHRQSDEADLIDRDKISRVGRLVFRLAYEVATRPEAPRWTEKGMAEVKPNTGGVPE